MFYTSVFIFFPNSYSKVGENVKLQVTQRREQGLINLKYECYLREERADSASTEHVAWIGYGQL